MRVVIAGVGKVGVREAQREVNTKLATPGRFDGITICVGRGHSQLPAKQTRAVHNQIVGSIIAMVAAGESQRTRGDGVARSSSMERRAQSVSSANTNPQCVRFGAGRNCRHKAQGTTR